MRPVRDIASLSGSNSGIIGTLGGSTVTSAIYVAGLDGKRPSPEYASGVGILLVAFLILVFSALVYASTPNTA